MILTIAPRLAAAVFQPEDASRRVRRHGLGVIDDNRGALKLKDLFSLVAVPDRALIKAALDTIIGGLLANDQSLHKIWMNRLPFAQRRKRHAEKVSNFAIRRAQLAQLAGLIDEFRLELGRSAGCFFSSHGRPCPSASSPWSFSKKQIPPRLSPGGISEFAYLTTDNFLCVKPK